MKKKMELLITNGTNIMVEQTKREIELKKVMDALEIIKTRPNYSGERYDRIDMTIPTFYENQRDLHPKKFLIELEKYFTFKKINGEDQMIVVDNALKTKRRHNTK